jgi:hypothetical protein
MRRPNSVFGVGLLLLALPLRADGGDPLAHADVVSTLGLARLADEVGDAQLLAWLKTPSRRDLTLVAVRATPFAAAPERLVPALAPHLCGRDPVLAPESALALAQIAERLTPSNLAAREALIADLKEARAALGCAKSDGAPAIRPDLLATVQIVDAAFSQLAP